MVKMIKARMGNHGFSLFEIIMVTVILATIAQLVGVNLIKQFPKNRLNRATQQFSWDLMSIRSQAIIRNKNAHMSLTGSSAYTLWLDDNGNNLFDPGEEQIVQMIHDDYQDVSISTSEASFENPLFNSRGFASNIATIPLGNSSGAKIINVDLSGFVSVD